MTLKNFIIETHILILLHFKFDLTNAFIYAK